MIPIIAAFIILIIGTILFLIAISLWKENAKEIKKWEEERKQR